MWRVPLSDLNYGPEEEAAVLDVLRSRWLTMGPRTEEFEAQVAAYLDVKHAIAVANCTCGLHLAYQLLLAASHSSSSVASTSSGTARKPVVLVPDITFVASSNAAISSGARPTFCDIIDLKTPTARATHAQALIDSASGAAAIFCLVHYAGFDAGTDEFLKLSRARGMMLVEDAAHAIGARNSAGQMLGTIGDIGCYSFFSNKNLATGEGGLLVTNNDDIATGLRLLRSHGMTSLTYQRHRSKSHGYDVVSIGHNYRCTEIMAALGIEQLKKLDAGNERRRQLYRLYCEAFGDESRLLVPFAESTEAIDRAACHIFPLVCAGAGLRDRIRDALTNAGVQTSHHYPPVHTFSYYRKTVGGGVRIPEMHELGDGFPPAWAGGRAAFPLAASVHYAARQITLPLHPNLKNSELEEIVSIVLRTVAES
ncbi:MAG: DegT/DnrJ/EryC1/StrS family aminotransferase [Candidatus Sumerlaeaceae bacterium]